MHLVYLILLSNNYVSCNKTHTQRPPHHKYDSDSYRTEQGVKSFSKNTGGLLAKLKTVNGRIVYSRHQIREDRVIL